MEGDAGADSVTVFASGAPLAGSERASAWARFVQALPASERAIAGACGGPPCSRCRAGRARITEYGNFVAAGELLATRNPPSRRDPRVDRARGGAQLRTGTDESRPPGDAAAGEAFRRGSRRAEMSGARSARLPATCSGECSAASPDDAVCVRTSPVACGDAESVISPPAVEDQYCGLTSRSTTPC